MRASITESTDYFGTLLTDELLIQGHEKRIGDINNLTVSKGNPGIDYSRHQFNIDNMWTL